LEKGEPTNKEKRRQPKKDVGAQDNIQTGLDVTLTKKKRVAEERTP